MSGATNADAGLASGLVNTTRMVGGSLGLAVMASLLTTRVGTLATAGADLGTAVTGGARLAMTFSAVLIVAALVVSVTVLRQSTGDPGHRPASARSTLTCWRTRLRGDEVCSGTGRPRRPGRGQHHSGVRPAAMRSARDRDLGRLCARMARLDLDRRRPT